VVIGSYLCTAICQTLYVAAWITLKFLAATSRAEKIPLPCVLRVMR